jgi:Short C-terminal domain
MADDDGKQLEALAKLHDDGVLTDEEFAAKKATILGRWRGRGRPRSCGQARRSWSRTRSQLQGRRLRPRAAHLDTFNVVVKRDGS